jgi:SAM-dependent methyltransferase
LACTSDRQIHNAKRVVGNGGPFCFGSGEKIIPVPAFDTARPAMYRPSSMKKSRTQGDYWGSYYDKAEAPVLPSQFALFVANEIVTGELPPVGTIFDVGCGNGRDALFFLQLGYQVRGLDASHAAIAVCHQRREAAGPDVAARGGFQAGAADDPAAWDRLTNDSGEGAALVYARFFFHAIDPAAEDAVLANAAKLLKARGGALCAEFRTPADRDAAKVTPEHYRRFIDLAAFTDRAVAVGLTPLWQAEGRGMAKYRQDDAHVARLIALA